MREKKDVSLERGERESNSKKNGKERRRERMKYQKERKRGPKR